MQTDDLRELLQKDNRKAIREFCRDSHPENVAVLLEQMEPDEAWGVLQMLDIHLRANIFSHLELENQVELATGQTRKNMAALLEEMPPDDRADLVQNLDEKLTDEILPLVAKAEREDIRKLVEYEEGTAGAVMSTEYAVLRPDIPVKDALEQIRVQAPEKETVYYIYVIDENRKLVGFVSLKDLIIARPHLRVQDVMHTDVIYANIKDDQETVAYKIDKFDLIAIPVVDDNNVLLGIVTHDDAIDIIRQEQTEDIEKLMAIRGHHEAMGYLRVSPWEHFKKRSGWIFILGIFGFASGFIVQRFEDVLVQFAVLATFMPMLADTGGNTGSQSATLVIRALALQEIHVSDVFRVLFKELLVSLPLAVLMAILAFSRLFLFAGAEPMPEDYTVWDVGLAVSVALGLQVISATLIGAILPLIAAAFKKDPAVVASPALTTMVDITGLLIYFTTVSLMLGL